jgi:putative chitinase
MVSFEQLRQIMPRLKKERAMIILPFLNAAMAEFSIDSRLRITAFLAQLAHESSELCYFEEIASGVAYEGRKDLGNTHAGDGMRYKGRGPIQLTGLKNYICAGTDLGLDLVNHPEQVATNEVGFRVAGWFWAQNSLNDLADNEDFIRITKRINGGFNGLAERQRYYEIAKKVIK